ncbi:MAG TPA: UDP-N-acetylglucosamine 1-carboxyvinyltransferase, partial [Acidobacteriota bacterium]|nr:UDP-N-acetylglucosamine 1-carboxyvinyltransferase [Acidobacteriota bacterium]
YQKLRNPTKLTAGPWPLFPTDLVSLTIVLATQAEGLCLIHDWMYEGRMFFVDKLVRMGGRITVCDPHRVIVQGPASLRATRLESPDIRAGMALVVAGLCAHGETTIEHAEVIERGYERVTERLQAVGAQISACHSASKIS